MKKNFKNSCKIPCGNEYKNIYLLCNQNETTTLRLIVMKKVSEIERKKLENKLINGIMWLLDVPYDHPRVQVYVGKSYDILKDGIRGYQDKYYVLF